MDRRHFAAFSVLAAPMAFCTDPNAHSDTPSATEISIGDVTKAVNDKNWTLVDTRPSDAYNGWKLDGVKRGGHLPGAVDFPATWLDSEHDAKDEILRRALRAKGLGPDQHIVLYGTNLRDRNRIAAYFRGAGFTRLYDFDFNVWADDLNQPLVRYKNFHLLLPPTILKQLLEGNWPETFERSRRPVKFVEVSWGEENASYSKGHVPGSFHVNTDHFEPPPAWMLGNPEVLGRFANQYGFQANDTVVISGEDPTASYRLAIVLRYMGVKDVRVLNGGFAAWKAAKYPIETTRNQPPIASSFGTRIPSRPRLIDDLARAKSGLATPATFALVDTRTWSEFTGETSGYTYHSHKGRIPGSIYGQADFKGTNSLTPYRNIDNTMRNADEIRELWKKSGIDPEKHLSFLCGSGWRAAEVLTFAQVMGLSNVSLYSDGWIGWSNDPRNPVESGPVISHKP